MFEVASDTVFAAQNKAADTVLYFCLGMENIPRYNFLISGHNFS